MPIFHCHKNAAISVNKVNNTVLAKPVQMLRKQCVECT